MYDRIVVAMDMQLSVFICSRSQRTYYAIQCFLFFFQADAFSYIFSTSGSNNLQQVKCEVIEKKLHRMRATGDFKVFIFKLPHVAGSEPQRKREVLIH